MRLCKVVILENQYEDEETYEKRIKEICKQLKSKDIKFIKLLGIYNNNKGTKWFITETEETVKILKELYDDTEVIIDIFSDKPVIPKPEYNKAD